MLPMGSVGIGMVYVLCLELEINNEKPYLRLPNRGNSKKRLEMAIGRSVYHSTPARTVLALEEKRALGFSVSKQRYNATR